MSQKSRKKEILTLALLVAFLPPAWAVAAPYLGNSVGPIALISAGIYGANNNQFRDALKISIGYLLGDLWALVASMAMSVNFLNMNIRLFLVLFVLGFIVVVVSNAVPKFIYMPSWLAGWAIGMLTMNLDTTTPRLSLTVQIAAAMLVGVYYVGALMDKIHRVINNN